jgi:beta-lactamase superfamily II metal-dependent hydrolase
VALLDVGQGESIVIRAPSGRTVLIDGGTSADEGRGEVGQAVIVPYLQAAGVDKIDAMVLTHADADHCNALPAVIREVPIGMALDGAAPFVAAQSSTHFAPEYQSVLAAWKRHQVPVRAAQAGQKLDLGDGVVLSVLAPLTPLLPGDNNNAAVLRLDYGQTSMLLTADIEASAEERLVRRGANLRCTVLKVGHHGSKTSSTAAFLQAAQPSAAIILLRTLQLVWTSRAANHERFIQSANRHFSYRHRRHYRACIRWPRLPDSNLSAFLTTWLNGVS